MNKKSKHLLVKCARYVPDKLYLQFFYHKVFRRFINFKTPKSYNEKIQWLKVYDRNPIYTELVDKYAAKEYVAKKIGREFIIPTIGVWDNVEDINFDELPEQFVLKCTHDSGSIVICNNKSQLDIDAAKKKLLMGMQRNGYWYGREWPYKNAKPRIIAEEFMKDESGTELKDYKFFCFNGKMKAMYIATDRPFDTRFNFYDRDFNFLPFCNVHPNSNKKIQKPDGYEEMIRIAEKLSEGFPHMRVDLYNIYGKIYFGEMTLHHASGMSPFKPESWDYTFGEWLELPEKRNK